MTIKHSGRAGQKLLSYMRQGTFSIVARCIHSSILLRGQSNGQNPEHYNPNPDTCGDLFAIAGALLKSRTDRGVEKLHTLSTATRDYASTLTDMPHLRAQVGAVSDSIEDVADYAVHTDAEHMFADVAAIARKHPVATIGVTVAAGMLAALFLRGTPVTIAEAKPQKARAKKKVVAAVRVRSNGKAKGSIAPKHAQN